MPKISLDNLERYDGHLKDWCDARFAERKVHENWHEAGPSGTVSFYPVPNRPIDPVVNFAFTETLPEGTKGPDNPSTITGVSSITVTRCETAGVDETQYTVNLGGTFYGGSVDLSAGTMTVTHQCDSITSCYMLVDAYSGFTQTETTAAVFVSVSRIPDHSVNPAGSNMFEPGDTNTGYNQYGWRGSVTTKICKCSFSKSSLGLSGTVTAEQAVAAVNALLAETPLEIAYRLATPYTVQLTPIQIYSLSQSDPYSPNTVYSDQQSVLVKYPKSPIVTGSELDNAILSLGGD